jgi:hypothetical protein
LGDRERQPSLMRLSASLRRVVPRIMAIRGPPANLPPILNTPAMRCSPPLWRPGRTLQARYTGGSRARMPAQPRVRRFYTSESQRPTQLVPFSASESVNSHRLSCRLPSASSASYFGLSASLSGPHHRGVRNTEGQKQCELGLDFEINLCHRREETEKSKLCA